MFIVSSRDMTIVNLSVMPIAALEIRPATGTFAFVAKYCNKVPDEYFYVHYSWIGWTERDFKEFLKYYAEHKEDVKKVFVEWYIENVGTDDVMTDIEAVKDFLSRLPDCWPCRGLDE